jgi:endonuclease I
MRFIFLTLFLYLITNALSAQPPENYYQSTEGKYGEELLIELHNIIKNHNEISYSGLWDAFYYTDRKSNNKVWDMYSDVPGGTPPYEYSFFSDQCGNYSGEGDCYNREHSFPKSWWGGSTSADQHQDLFHLYPTDGSVNGRRSNYPFGEVSNATWTSLNGSKVGPSGYSGYSGTVFEPIDEYKGDFARSYFYMAARYNNEIHNWNSDMLDGSSFPVYTEWAISMLIEWHEVDPVSDKEINRNNKIYDDYQGNRNPFIDNPEFVNSVWGDDPSSLPQFSVEKINVWPNPANSYIVISTNYHQTASVSIYNLTGNLIFKSENIDTTTEIKICVEKIPSGIYVIELASKNDIKTGRFVISR